MRTLLVFAALPPLLLASKYSPAHANQTKLHKKIYQLSGNWTARYDERKASLQTLRFPTASMGLINGVTPRPARSAGDTLLTY
jgi:hypothetical protein